jgi:Ser/Thr protein kinase RdoA (MazF antagonist)
VGSQQPFRHRPSLDLAGFGEASRDFLLASGLIPPEVRSEWTAITRQALDAVGCAFERYPAIPYLRLHGDCHAGNVLWTDQGAHFVDFDDCLTGPAVQDMWMMFSGSPEEIARQRREFLRGYRTFRDFDESEFALVEPLRTLRLIHYSAWLARRWNDPAFPPAFPFFGSVHYWRDRVHEMAEQLSLMRRCP